MSEPLFKSIAAGLCAATLLAAPAGAHEFWIEPEAHVVEPGRELTAQLRNGVLMEGPSLPYIERWFDRFEIWSGGASRPVDGDTGDAPAIRFKPEAPGALRIVYVSRPDRLDFAEFEDFRAYTEKEGIAWAAEEHIARGLEKSGFTELYIRCAKALVRVGDGAGEPADAPTGMPLELVALADPHASPAPASLPVALLWNGAPLSGAQVTVFHEPAGGGEITRRPLFTGADGRVTVPIAPGRYLLNALHMEGVDEAGAVWRSYWASLTFAGGG